MVFYSLLAVLDHEARLQLVSLYNTMIAFSFASRHLSSCAGNQLAFLYIPIDHHFMRTRHSMYSMPEQIYFGSLRLHMSV